MQKHHLQIVHARSLRADVIAAPATWIPRREIILDWLNAFITRAQISSYSMDEVEGTDLAALELFLRKMKTPVTALSSN